MDIEFKPSTSAFDWSCHLCGWRLPEEPTKFPDRVINQHLRAHGLGPRGARKQFASGDPQFLAAREGSRAKAARLDELWAEARPSFAHRASGEITRDTGYPRYKCECCGLWNTNTTIHSFPCWAAAGFDKVRDKRFSAKFRQEATVQIRERWAEVAQQVFDEVLAKRNVRVRTRARTAIAPVRAGAPARY